MRSQETVEKVWSAIYVKSRTEKKVAEALQEKNIETYVPLIKTMRQWSDRKKLVEVPLLNGYVFVNIQPNEQDIVAQTKGVVNFVRSEKKVAIIRNVEIESLRQLVKLGYQLEVFSVNSNYKGGDKVKITSGPLKNLEGFVLENKENKQIDILLENLGQCIRVKLPPELLVKK